MESIPNEGNLVAHGLLGIGILTVSSEMLMYIYLYIFLITNHRMKIQNENEVKAKVRKNVINLVGHSMNFVVELLWLILAVVTTGPTSFPKSMMWISRALVMSLYGILSALQIWFSTLLSNDCKVIWDRMCEIASSSQF